MRPTPDQIGFAVQRLSALTHFPANTYAHEEIMRLIFRMVGTVDQLEWLVRTMIDRVGEWKGPRELRAIFCTRFAPLDGIEEWSSVPGFTPADSEARSMSEAAPKFLPAPDDESVE